MLSILTASFLPFLFVMLIIVVHELGHFLCALLLKIPVNKIYLYPFGGISKFDSKINMPLKVELFILIMGPLTQIIFAFFFKNLLSVTDQKLFLFYHHNILFFNLLPIYPLDGGRILNILFSYHYSYQKSFFFSILLSLFTVFLCSFFLILDWKINTFLLLSLLIFKIYEEWRKRKFYQERFLLERYLRNYHFKKKCIVSNLNDFKRDYHHLVKGKSRYYTEKEALEKKFILKSK